MNPKCLCVPPYFLYFVKGWFSFTRSILFFRFRSDETCPGSARADQKSRWTGIILTGIRQPAANSVRSEGDKKKKKGIGGKSLVGMCPGYQEIPR